MAARCADGLDRALSGSDFRELARAPLPSGARTPHGGGGYDRSAHAPRRGTVELGAVSHAPESLALLCLRRADFRRCPYGGSSAARGATIAASLSRRGGFRTLRSWTVVVRPAGASGEGSSCGGFKRVWKFRESKSLRRLHGDVAIIAPRAADELPYGHRRKSARRKHKRARDSGA